MAERRLHIFAQDYSDTTCPGELVIAIANQTADIGVLTRVRGDSLVMFFEDLIAPPPDTAAS